MKALILLPLIFAWVKAEVPCLRSDLLCEFDHESHPAKECFRRLSTRIQTSVKADCMSYLGKDLMDVFRKNIEVVCKAKGAPIDTVQICPLDITTPTMDLSMCELDDPTHPMHDCYTLMGTQIQKSLKADCLAYIGTDAMEDFMKNGAAVCNAKKANILPIELTTTTPPMNFVDPCDLDNKDHVAHDCYTRMGFQIQKNLKADCIAAEDTPALDDLAKNIEALCKAKGSGIRDLSLTTQTPPMEFVDPCDLDNKDHVAHDCYTRMGFQIQKNLKADCIAAEDTPALDDLAKNIEALCKAKGSGIRDLSPPV